MLYFYWVQSSPITNYNQPYTVSTNYQLQPIMYTAVGTKQTPLNTEWSQILFVSDDYSIKKHAKIFLNSFKSLP
jgi:hypothetical protein